MKSFMEFVEVQKNERMLFESFVLMEEHGIDTMKFCEWYVNEGKYLNESEINEGIGDWFRTTGSKLGGIAAGLAEPVTSYVGGAFKKGREWAAEKEKQIEGEKRKAAIEKAITSLESIIPFFRNSKSLPKMIQNLNNVLIQLETPQRILPMKPGGTTTPPPLPHLASKGAMASGS